MVYTTLPNIKMTSKLTVSEDEVNAQAVLEKGLSDLADLCDVVLEKFEAAVADHENKMAVDEPEV